MSSVQMRVRFELTRDEFVIQNLFACVAAICPTIVSRNSGVTAPEFTVASQECSYSYTTLYSSLYPLLTSPHLTSAAKMEMQNANPTILSIADLPTRKPAASARPKRAHAFLPPTYAADPFAATSDLVADEGTDESEDDDEADGIDAQEIYGILLFPVSTLCWAN